MCSEAGGPPGLIDISVTLHAEHTRCLSVCVNPGSGCAGGGVDGGGSLLQALTELPVKV